MSQTNTGRLTLDKLLFNNPEEIDIPGVGRVLVREPTRGEKIMARVDATKLPYYDKLTELEQTEEQTMRLIPSCFVEPKMTYDEFLNMPQSVQMAVYDMVTMWLATRTARLSDKRKQYLKDFLQQMKGLNLETSSRS